MGTFQITSPDGSVWEVDADTPEAADQKLKGHIRSETAAKEAEAAPPLQRARMWMDDINNQIAYGLTAGLFDKGFDKLTGAQSAETTAKGAERLGPTASTALRAGGAVMVPSSGPLAVARVGGGPLVRAVTGAGVAGAEGAAYGGAEAAAEDKPILPGMLAGGAGGVIGQGVAQGVGAGVNKAVKAAKGIDDVPPVRNILRAGNNPSNKDLVDVAAAKATHKGSLEGTVQAVQDAQKDEFGKLLSGQHRGGFTPEQRRLMGKVAYGDPGTRAASGASNILENPLVAGGFGAAGGYGGGFIPGVLAAASSMALGNLARKDSAAATQEAVDNLRRLMYKQPKFIGPAPTRVQRKAGQGLGYLDKEYLDNYLE